MTHRPPDAAHSDFRPSISELRSPLPQPPPQPRPRESLTIALLLALLFIASAAGCATEPRRFGGEIVRQVNDRHPIEKPDKRWSPKYWDPADAIGLRPLTHLFLLRTPRPAKNANALGAVPDSSWFTNRMSRTTLSPQRVARGPCITRQMPEADRWVLRSGKVGGDKPGFVIELQTPDGSTRRYRLRFDDALQTERATAANIVGSKIYWAAGFEAPCNRIVYIDPDRLVLADDATKEDRYGRQSPLTLRDLRLAIEPAPRDESGRVRALTSRFLPGEPLGPFSWEGVRGDDPNDTIPHQHRRELRGSRLLAAWINHFDAREQNTSTSFIRTEDGRRGYVQHFIFDFDDSLGSRWFSELMTRRFGHSWYVDPLDIVTDLATLGLVPRPWYDMQRSKEAPIFGYFDVAQFDPTEWKAGFPNIAYRQMDDRDAFWATNIISRFGDAHIRRIVAEAKFTKPVYARYLERVLIGRRDRIVETYFREMSPLVDPRVAGHRLCATDAWVDRGYGPADAAFYEVGYRWRRTGDGFDWSTLDRTADPDARLCVDLPPVWQWRATQGDLSVGLRVRRIDQTDPARPTRFILRPQPVRNTYKLVGILRVGDAP